MAKTVDEVREFLKQAKTSGGVSFVVNEIQADAKGDPIRIKGTVTIPATDAVAAFSGRQPKAATPETTADMVWNIHGTALTNNRMFDLVIAHSVN
jgi:hypothetical protein